MGLGDIKIHSFLDQPLEAEIELIDVGSMPLTSIKASIASVEEFEKMSMDRSYVLEYLNLAVVKKPNGKLVIQINSSQRITEPYIQLLIDLAWPNGQVYRAYTVLLDPPNYKLIILKKRLESVAKKPRFKMSTHQSGMMEKETITHVGSSQEGLESHGPMTYGPTVENESIWQIAQRYKTDDIILQQVILSIVGRNPQAFSEGNLNGLKPGQTLAIPGSSEMSKIPAKLAKMEVYEQDNAWQAKRSIHHVLQPPYFESQVTSAEPIDDESPLGYVESFSKLPPVPLFTKGAPVTPIITTLPASLLSAQNFLMGNNESATLQKAKDELAIAGTALQSVREANILLNEQIHLMQTENKRLQSQLRQRDRTIAQLQKDILLIKQRQGLAGQGSATPTYESESMWPWFLLLLLTLGAVGGLGYWRYWVRPKEEEPNEKDLLVVPIVENKNTSETLVKEEAIPPTVVSSTASPEREPEEIIEQARAEETDEIKTEDSSIDFVPEPVIAIEEIEEPKESIIASEDVGELEKGDSTRDIISPERVITTEEIDDSNDSITSSEGAAEINTDDRSLDFVPEPIIGAEKIEKAEDEKDNSVEFEPGIIVTEKEVVKEKEPPAQDNIVEFSPVNVDTEPAKDKPAKSYKALDTLLDLARTYISMADIEAAKQSLQEVLEHGNEKQKQEAQDLLDSINKK